MRRVRQPMLLFPPLPDGHAPVGEAVRLSPGDVPLQSPRPREHARSDDRSIAQELARIAGEIRALEEKRRQLIDRYATEQMAGEAYIAANRALDRDLERLTREKAELVAALQSPQHEDFVDASIRHFCASARARLQACADFDAKREFLLRHVERVIYSRYQVTVTGSIPVQSASGDTKLQFRIEGEIDRKAVRSGRRTICPADARPKEWKGRMRSTASRLRGSAQQAVDGAIAVSNGSRASR